MESILSQTEDERLPPIYTVEADVPIDDYPEMMHQVLQGHRLQEISWKATHGRVSPWSILLTNKEGWEPCLSQTGFNTSECQYLNWGEYCCEYCFDETPWPIRTFVLAHSSM